MGKGGALRIRPCEQATLGFLLVAVATLGVRAAGGAPAWGAFAGHAALLAVFALLAALCARGGEAPWAVYGRVFAVCLLFTSILYASVGRAGFQAFPARDALVARADAALCGGRSPALWMERHVTFGRLEFFSFIYGFFIPYLYLSIFLGSVGRPAHEREEFLTGFAITYAAAFLGYLFVPARGPVEFHAADFQSALQGGFFHRVVLHGVGSTGGNLGAFPSLHVGASAYACLFDLRTNRLRGLTYVPLVPLIAVATIVLRYHYVTDLLVGVAIASAAVWLAPRWYGAWAAAHAGD